MPPRGRFLAHFDSVGKIMAGLSGLVALITGIVSLVYLLWPDPAPPPLPRKATLTITQNLGEWSFEEFLLDTGRSTDGYSRTRLDQLGRYYYVRVAIDGLRDRSPEIVWSLRSADPAVGIEDPERWIHQFLARFTPPADSYSRTAKVWIQRPPVGGTFFAVIEIAYPQNETLDAVRTPTFSGRQVMRSTTLTKTLTTVTTVPETTNTTVTTVNGTTSTSTTTTPAMTSTNVATVRTTVLKPVAPAQTPIVRPPAVIVSSTP